MRFELYISKSLDSFFFLLCAYPFWIGNNELKMKEHVSGNLEN